MGFVADGGRQGRPSPRHRLGCFGVGVNTSDLWDFGDAAAGAPAGKVYTDRQRFPVAFRTIQKSTGTPSVKRSEIKSAVRSVTCDSHAGRFIARSGERSVRVGPSKSSTATLHQSRKTTGTKRRVG